MNKLIITLLVASLTVLSACGSDNDNTNPASNNGSALTDANNDNDTSNNHDDTDTDTNDTDTSDTDDGFNTGLPKDKKLSELSEDESRLFQTKINAELTSEEKSLQYCNFETAYNLGFKLDEYETDTDLQAACTAQLPLCIQNEKDNETRRQNQNGTLQLPDSCEATVGELEACYFVQLDNAQQNYSRTVPCESLTKSIVQELQKNSLFDADSSPPCQAFIENCPGFFPDGLPDIGGEVG